MSENQYGHTPEQSTRARFWVCRTADNCFSTGTTQGRSGKLWMADQYIYIYM